MLVFLVACKKSVEKDTIQKPVSKPVVESVGQDIESVDNVEEDLSTEDLEDLDAGLSDVEDI